MSEGGESRTSAIDLPPCSDRKEEGTIEVSNSTDDDVSLNPLHRRFAADS